MILNWESDLANEIIGYERILNSCSNKDVNQVYHTWTTKDKKWPKEYGSKESIYKFLTDLLIKKLTTFDKLIMFYYFSFFAHLINHLMFDIQKYCSPSLQQEKINRRSVLNQSTSRLLHEFLAESDWTYVL